MWISDPTPVISNTKQIDSWSVSNDTFAWKCPTAIHVYRCWSWLRSVSPSRAKKAIRA